MVKSSLDRHSRQDGREREDRECEQAAGLKYRRCSEAADCRAGVDACDREHVELHRGAGGVASRHDVGYRVPHQPGGYDREEGSSTQGDPLQREGAGERGRFRHDAEDHEGRLQ